MTFLRTFFFTILFLVVTTSIQAVPPQRDYTKKVTAQEEKDIRYIVTQMATLQWDKLWSNRGKLKAVGDRVGHVHPLRFLMCVFCDEEMKGACHCIKDRKIKKIWREFTKGLYESLETETKRNNMSYAFIDHFATTVGGVTKEMIVPPLLEQNWDQFMDLLLQHIPRSGDPGRYDQ